MFLIIVYMSAFFQPVMSAETGTPISGSPQIVKSQMITYYLEKSPISFPEYYNTSQGVNLNKFIDIVWEEALAEGIRPEVVFAQMLVETGYFKFGGDVKIEQFNFCGLGATGGGVPGLTFPDIRIGIRAQVQHLKGYAVTTPLNQTLVDPRYQYIIPLGKTNNSIEGLSGTWAMDLNYATKIIAHINGIRAQLIIDPVVRQYADNVVWKDNAIELTGWMLLEGVDLSSESVVEKNILVRDSAGNELGRYPATDILRTDVTTAIGKGSFNYNYSGYRATLPLTAMIQNGNYKISLEFKAAGGYMKEVGVNYPSSAGLASLPSKVVGSKHYQLAWTTSGLQITSSDYAPPVRQYADNVVWKDNALELTGWMTLEGVDLSSEASVEKNILVRDSAGNELGRYPATDILRTDVTSVFGKGYNYNYSGYRATLPVTAMTQNGSYKISLEFKAGGFVKEVGVNYPSSAWLASLPSKVVGSRHYQLAWTTSGLQITGSDYAPTVRQYADNVVWKDNTLELTGWMTLEGVDLSSEASVEKNILVRDSAGNELGRYPATDILRTDVTSAFGKGYNYNYSGYRATLPVTAMTQNGSYKISLEFKAGGFVKEVGVNYPSSAQLATLPSKVVGSRHYQLAWATSGLQITSSEYAPNVRQYVDNVVWKDNALELTGWMTLEGVDLSSEASVEKNILVRDSAGNELGRYSATDILRTDVTSAFGKGYNYNYSGYRVSLPMSAMTSDGSYGIFLEFKSGGYIKEVAVNNPSSAYLSAIPGKVVGAKLYQPKWATAGFQIGVTAPKYTVMLDPGHEGKYPFDPGAVNSTLNILEYQLNNQLALKVAAQLTANGFKVVYTRNPELQAAASLKQRADLANEVKPDLFISIHHDSSVLTTIRGFSIHWSSYRYNLDTSGLTVYLSGKAYPFVRQFKQIENSKEETYIVYLDGGIEKTMNIDTDIVVKDSTLSSAAQGSQKFANILYNYLMQLDYVGPRTNPVSDHNLYVTRETNVPSVLFEGGFLSNSTEAQLISNSANQDKFAAKVSAAVVEYFK